MNSINVKVDHGHATHRFTLLRTAPRPHYPTFAQLCEALIHHLKLRATVTQLISPHPPIHVWYLGDEPVRLRDDSSVRAALRKTPHTLRLCLRYRHSRSSKSGSSAPSHAPSRSDTIDELYVPSPTTLLRLLNHAENHARDRTKDAFEQLRQSMLKHSGDAVKFANARHRLSRLYCSFLRRLRNTPVDKVQKTLEPKLLARLEVILEDEEISEATIRAARRVVRLMCSDRHALIHMRTRWVVIEGRATRVAPPSTAPPTYKPRDRPVKHYRNLVQKLLQVSGGDVQATYTRLMNYVKRHDAFDKAKPGVSRDLCRAVEKIVFHVVRCHKKEGKFVIQSNAARALAASVGRKFERAGFGKRFVTRVSGVTRAMIDDPAAVELAFGWAKKRSEREASAAGDSGAVERLEDEDDDELFGGGRDVDDTDSTTTSETSSTSEDDDLDGQGSRRSRSASGRSRSASRRSRSAGKGSRSGSRASRTRSASGSRAGSKGRGRSRSASRVAEEEASRRGRSRSRSTRRSGRSESRGSLRSMEEDADEMIRSKRSSRDSKSEKDKLDILEGSSVDSSDDGKIYRYDNDDSDDGSGHSNDTSRSQWARVQMELEKERLRRMYLNDRQLFDDRDGSAQVDVSKRLRHAKDSVALRSLHDVPSPSEAGESFVTDEPVRRVESMKAGRSPRGRRKSRSPHRKNLLWFRAVGKPGVVS